MRTVTLLHSLVRIYRIPDVIGSSEFSGLPSSCAPGDATRLHHVCYRMKVKESDYLSDLVHHELSNPLNTYYSGTVTDVDSSEWLETSLIPSEQQSSITALYSG